MEYYKNSFYIIHKKPTLDGEQIICSTLWIVFLCVCSLLTVKTFFRTLSVLFAKPKSSSSIARWLIQNLSLPLPFSLAFFSCFLHRAEMTDYLQIICRFECIIFLHLGASIIFKYRIHRRKCLQLLRWSTFVRSHFLECGLRI